MLVSQYRIVSGHGLALVFLVVTSVNMDKTTLLDVYKVINTLGF